MEYLSTLGLFLITLGVNVGKYSSTMDPLGKIPGKKTHKNCYETSRNSITAAVAGVDGGTIDMLVGHQASLCHGTENFGSLHGITSWENTN